MGSNVAPPLPQAKRGEIWWVPIPSDPPGKLDRPVLIVSSNNRNAHPKASTVLVVPFSMTLSDVRIHIRLKPGETGLPEPSELQPENISTMRKESLRPNKGGTRTLGESILR
jgi:mRNA-degrading endonuclease toxin of MazEF toxin-antitoxin module